MKLSLAIYINLPFSAAFIPAATRVSMTELSALSRREALLALGTSALIGAPAASKAGTANPFLEEEINFEPSQMPQGDKIDINGAFVVSLLS
jgi:photosystem II PsbU protein